MAEAAEGYHKSATGKNARESEWRRVVNESREGDSSAGPQKVELTRVNGSERMGTEVEVEEQNARLKRVSRNGKRLGEVEWKKKGPLAFSGLLCAEAIGQA